MNSRLALTERQVCEWPGLEPNLQAVFLDVLGFWPLKFMEVTRLISTPEEETAIRRRIAEGKGLDDSDPDVLRKQTSGIHVVPWAGSKGRSGDVRVWPLGRPGHSMREEMERIAGSVNGLWSYDPNRPGKLVVYAKPHGTGPHLHLQVHPNTIRRAA